MDKITIAALGLPTTAASTTVQIGDAQVEIAHTIPYEKLLEMVQWCINLTLDERPFMSEPIRQIVVDFALVKYFTNIETPLDDAEFDLDKMYENYDLLLGHNAIETIKQNISPKQLEMFISHFDKTCASIIQYKNSAAGIVDKLSAMAKSNTNTLNEALEEFSDPNKLEQVQRMMEIVDKLGTPQGDPQEVPTTEE